MNERADGWASPTQQRETRQTNTSWTGIAIVGQENNTRARVTSSDGDVWPREGHYKVRAHGAPLCALLIPTKLGADQRPPRKRGLSYAARRLTAAILQAGDLARAIEYQGRKLLGDGFETDV